MHQVWPQVEKYLADACAFSNGSYSLDQAKIYLIRGDWHLLLIVDTNNNGFIRGATTIQFSTHANDRVGHIHLAGGRLMSNPGVVEQLIEYAKSHGATCLQAATRPAMVRLMRRYFGFSEKHTIVELKI